MFTKYEEASQTSVLSAFSLCAWVYVCEVSVYKRKKKKIFPDTNTWGQTGWSHDPGGNSQSTSKTSRAVSLNIYCESSFFKFFSWWNVSSWTRWKSSVWLWNDHFIIKSHSSCSHGHQIRSDQLTGIILYESSGNAVRQCISKPLNCYRSIQKNRLYQLW